MELVTKNQVLIMEAKQHYMTSQQWMDWFSGLMSDGAHPLGDDAKDHIQKRIDHHSFMKNRKDGICSHMEWGEYEWQKVGEWIYTKGSNKYQGIIAECKICLKVKLFKKRSWHRMIRGQHKKMKKRR
jgi:hypothetical protein